jgi:hypothetical protein
MSDPYGQQQDPNWQTPPTYGPVQPYNGPPQGQPYQPPSHPQQAVYVNAQDGNNTSLAPVTSLVTGLIALFIAWIPILGIGAWVLAPISIIFGILGLKRGKAEHKIMSIMGLVAGGIALLICILYLILFVAAAFSE